MYDPSIGRFVRRDPAQATLNEYLYVENNPLNKIDPSGQEELTFPVFPFGGTDEEKREFEQNLAEYHAEAWQRYQPVDDEAAIAAMVLEPVEAGAKSVFGIPITFQDRNGYLEQTVTNLGGANVRGLVYLGLEIAHRIRQIDSEIAKLEQSIRDKEFHSGKALMTVYYPPYIGYLASCELNELIGTCETKEELASLIADLEQAKQDLREFFDEAGLEVFFNPFDCRVAGADDSPDSGYREARRLYSSVALPRKWEDDGIERADFWILFMPSSIITGGGLRAITVALGRGGLSAIAKCASRATLNRVIAKLSLSNVRGRLAPQIREYVITIWRSELGAVDAWALMTLGIRGSKQPLPDTIKKILREEARNILGPRFGIKLGSLEGWKSLGYSVHHLIPLRFAHLFRQNPNRPGLIAAMENSMHTKADDAWRIWEKSLKCPPTADEVLEQAKVFHREFGEHMWIAPGKKSTFP